MREPDVVVVARGNRPNGWQAAATVDGNKGYVVNGLAPGNYTLFARYTDSPETPVREMGSFRLT